ncbi:unnamed protein product [Lampetra planeri]
MQQKVAIYGPPSNTRHRFATRRRGDTETPLAFRSALLALAKATYPRRDEEGSDALGMEKHGSCWNVFNAMHAVQSYDLFVAHNGDSDGVLKCLEWYDLDAIPVFRHRLLAELHSIQAGERLL